MTKTISKIAALGFVLFTTAFIPFAKADEWDKKAILTTHEPIRIEGKVLGPGQYVMKLLESADRHLVEIYDVDNSKLEMTVLAIPVYRFDTRGDTQLTFAETKTDKRRLYAPGSIQETTQASSFQHCAKTRLPAAAPRALTSSGQRQWS